MPQLSMHRTLPANLREDLFSLRHDFFATGYSLNLDFGYQADSARDRGNGREQVHVGVRKLRRQEPGFTVETAGHWVGNPDACRCA